MAFYLDQDLHGYYTDISEPDRLANSRYGVCLGWLQFRKTVTQSRWQVSLTLPVIQLFSSKNPYG
jgi:hypothetical protein